VLAVDLGGTKTTFAHVDECGVVVDRQKAATDPALDRMVRRIAERAGDASAVGIVVPGIYTPSTCTAWCPNVWGRREVPVLDALRRHVTVPIAIDSDRAGCVVGEAWLGAARGLRDVAFVAIGTGIGVGILSGARVLGGAHGIAGAAGWFALDPRWTGAYGTTGCWEAEAAGPGVARSFGRGDATTAIDAARDGDPGANAILDRAAAYTGMGIANLVSILNPEAIVIGGGFGLALAALRLDRIRADVGRWAQPLAATRCRLEASQLGEDAALLGAARLALDRAHPEDRSDLRL
jgi:glucokinase